MDLTAKILPHFETYPLRGAKARSFAGFAEVCRMIRQGDHLTRDGIAKIVTIAYEMNLGKSGPEQARGDERALQLRRRRDVQLAGHANPGGLQTAGAGEHSKGGGSTSVRAESGSGADWDTTTSEVFGSLGSQVVLPARSRADFTTIALLHPRYSPGQGSGETAEKWTPATVRRRVG